MLALERLSPALPGTLPLVTGHCHPRPGWGPSSFRWTHQPWRGTSCPRARGEGYNLWFPGCWGGCWQCPPASLGSQHLDPPSPSPPQGCGHPALSSLPRSRTFRLWLRHQYFHPHNLLSSLVQHILLTLFVLVFFFFFFSQATSACEYSDAFLCIPLLFRRLRGRVSPTSSCHGFLHNWTLWVFFQPFLSVGTPAWRWRMSFIFMAWEAPHWNAFSPGNSSREVINRRKAEKERGSFLNLRVLWTDCCEHSGGPCRDGAGVPLPTGGDSLQQVSRRGIKGDHNIQARYTLHKS